MIKAKAHLKQLYRTSANKISREDFLRLDFNESVSGLPKYFVKKTLSGINPKYIAMYPEYDELQKKLAKNNNVNPRNICLANGSDAAIKYIFDAFISRGDRVLFANPTFAMYSVYCKIFNAQAVTVDYSRDLVFPFKEYIGRLNTDIRMAIIVNPNSPTGDILRYKDLMAIISRARKHNILLVIDEAYFYFCPMTTVKLVKKYKNLIVLRSFSKIFGMAGARLGYAVACPEIINSLKKVKPTFDVNGLAVKLAIGIMDNPKIIKTLVKNAKEGKGYLCKQLSKERIEYKAGQANFILIKCYGRFSQITKKLAKKGILVNSGFEHPFLHDCIRVTTGDIKHMRYFWNAFVKIWRSN